jgi:hypothetical protein
MTEKQKNFDVEVEKPKRKKRITHDVLLGESIDMLKKNKDEEFAQKVILFRKSTMQEQVNKRENKYADIVNSAFKFFALFGVTGTIHTIFFLAESRSVDLNFALYLLCGPIFTLISMSLYKHDVALVDEIESVSPELLQEWEQLHAEFNAQIADLRKQIDRLSTNEQVPDYSQITEIAKALENKN